MSSLTYFFAQPSRVGFFVLCFGLMPTGCSTTDPRAIANPCDIASDYSNVYSVYWNDIAEIAIQIQPAYEESIKAHLKLLNTMTHLDSLTLRFLLQEAPDRIITQAGNAPWITFEPSEEEIANLVQEPEYRNTSIRLEEHMSQWRNDPNRQAVVASSREALRSDAGKLTQSRKDTHLNRVILRIKRDQGQALRMEFPTRNTNPNRTPLTEPEGEKTRD